MNKNYFYKEFLNEIYVAYFNAEKGYDILFDETLKEEWDEYQEWLNAGNSLEPYVAPPVVPYVDPHEARISALESNEIIDDAVDTSLLSLMASASARLDSIEVRLAALEGGN